MIKPVEKLMGATISESEASIAEIKRSILDTVN